MTRPNPPSKPGIIHLGATEVQLIWYAGLNGAYKYMVEAHSDADEPGSKAGGFNRSKISWVAVYEGAESTALIRALHSSVD